MSDSTGRLDVLIVRLAEELGDGDSGPYRSWLEARFPISRRAATPGRRKTHKASIRKSIPQPQEQKCSSSSYSITWNIYSKQ